MIALDTNVLVRYVMRDDPAQVPIADRLIEEAQQTGETLFVSCVVICELVWVLRRGHRAQRTEIVTLLDALLESPVFALERADDVRDSTRGYANGPGDFADHLVGRIAVAAGADSVATFDRALQGVDGFTVLA